MSTDSQAASGSISIRVRYNECDPMGVAHHTVYPVWFEMGRTELLRTARTTDQQNNHATGSEVRSYRDLETQGLYLAVVALEVRYKRPAKYDDVLELHTTLVDAGHVKIEHTYELMRDGILLATGATTLACLDREGRPQPLPPILRSLSSSRGHD